VYVSNVLSADVINMLDKMIKVVDEELSDEGLMSIGDAVLPHIEHWDRLVTVLSNRAVGVITILPALLGVSSTGGPRRDRDHVVLSVCLGVRVRIRVIFWSAR
jgi:hypothetical protein